MPGSGRRTPRRRAAAVFSFVFGVPPMAALAECRLRSIVTIGAATTIDEAAALEEAGVDVIVASVVGADEVFERQTGGADDRNPLLW